MSPDWASRFGVAWAFGPTEEAVVPTVVRLTRQRTHGQTGVPWIRDGRKAYEKAIRRVDRDPQRSSQRGRPPLVLQQDVSLTQVVQQRRGGRVGGVAVRPVLGTPPACPYGVHEERLNGVWRDRLNALTRKTHAFARQARTWDALVTLGLFEHNGIRPHRALREEAEGLSEGRRYRQRTPAMAIGWTDHIWSWEEFLSFRHYQYSQPARGGRRRGAAGGPHRHRGAGIGDGPGADG